MRAGRWDVTLVERVAPGHVRAGSGDESRLIRCVHGADAWHTASARRAWELWHEIDPWLVVPAGMAWFARRDDGWEADSERTLRAQGIPCERVDAAELFPSFAGDDVRWTLYEPEAGILRARDATRTLAAQAVAAGARLRLAEARPDGAGLRARRRHAAGGRSRRVGLRGLAAAAVPRRAALRITQQDVFYFGAGAAWGTPGVPGWVDYDGAAYGLGDLDGRGVKVAPDGEGPRSTPRPSSASRCPRTRAGAREYLTHRFPALADAPLVGHRACQYELTADTQFVIAPHPELGERVWLMGGGSGCSAITKCMSWVISYWHARWPTSGASASAGKRSAIFPLAPRRLVASTPSFSSAAASPMS